MRKFMLLRPTTAAMIFGIFFFVIINCANGGSSTDMRRNENQPADTEGQLALAAPERTQVTAESQTIFNSTTDLFNDAKDSDKDASIMSSEELARSTNEEDDKDSSIPIPLSRKPRPQESK